MTDIKHLEVLAVCGVGMGSSLILRMTAESAFKQLGIDASVTNTDISTAKGMSPDVVLGQGMHISELGDLAPIVIEITDFLDADALALTLRSRLRDQGYSL